jgi:hypothetical protein
MVFCSGLDLLCWNTNFIHLNVNLPWSNYSAGADGAQLSGDHDDCIAAISGSPQVASGSKKILQVEGICFCRISNINS